MSTTPKKSFYDLMNSDSQGDMASTLSSKLVNLRRESLANILSDFENSAHKLEYVTTLDGVDFINDSRSTNPNAVWFALESMKKPTIWIMSIQDLESIDQSLADLINKKVKSIVMLGVYSSAIFDFYKGLKKEIFVAMNLEEAVRTAFYAAKVGIAYFFHPVLFVAEFIKIFVKEENSLKKQLLNYNHLALLLCQN